MGQGTTGALKLADNRRLLQTAPRPRLTTGFRQRLVPTGEHGGIGIKKRAWVEAVILLLSLCLAQRTPQPCDFKDAYSQRPGLMSLLFLIIPTVTAGGGAHLF